MQEVIVLTIEQEALIETFLVRNGGEHDLSYRNELMRLLSGLGINTEKPNPVTPRKARWFDNIPEAGIQL